MNDAAALAGCTILLTRPSDEAGAMADALAGAGAVVIECPAIEFASLVEENIAQMRNVLAALGERQGWLILPSPTAVRHFGEMLSRLNLAPEELSGVRMAVVGAGSGAALLELGFDPAFVPESATGEGLAGELPATAQTPALILGSTQSRPELRETLTRRGVMVQTLPLYAPQPCAEGLARLRGALEERERGEKPGPCLMLLTSPSAVDAIGESLADESRLMENVGWVAIGPTTHRRILEIGIDPTLAARAGEPRAESVVAAAAELAARLRGGGTR